MSRATPEGKITKKITDYLKAMRKGGVEVQDLKIAGAGMQRAGEPDLFICYKGRLLVVEVKAPGVKQTRLQSKRMHDWIKAGACGAVVHSYDGFIAAWVQFIRMDSSTIWEVVWQDE